MLKTNQIRARLAGLLKGDESFSDFAEWLSRESASLRFEDKALIDFADSVLSPLQVYFDGLIDSESLKNELLLLLLSDHNVVQEFEVRFVFDDSPTQSTRPVAQEFAVNSQVATVAA